MFWDCVCSSHCCAVFCLPVFSVHSFMTARHSKGEGFHYTSEVRFSEPVADYIIRNPRSKWNLRSESLEKFHKSQVNSSIWLPPLQTPSESCKLHHLLAPRPAFCAIKKSHWQSCATSTHSYVVFLRFRTWTHVCIISQSRLRTLTTTNDVSILLFWLTNGTLSTRLQRRY